MARYLVCVLLFLTMWAILPAAQTTATPSCTSCTVWNLPQKPFRIYGNTYFVGPHGLSSILITSSAGHVLIDGALPESVPQIAAHIKQLGFQLSDVKLIVNSHVHFDHAGGISELQRMTGARVVASPWSRTVLLNGGVGKNDPQYGSIQGIPRVNHVEELHDGETFHIGDIAITAHLTPGHTPGGTSWTWTSCEASRCASMVYADSLTAISTKGFKFTSSTQYPTAIQDFEKGFAFLNSTPCDILLTSHPDISHLWDRLQARDQGNHPDPMIDPSACRQLAASAREQLQQRIAEETSTRSKDGNPAPSR